MDEESTETIETTSHVVDETITKKDPRKVEQGKRLASISRAAKEKKMRERIENEMKNEQSSYTSKIPRSLLVGLPLLTVYFLYNRYNKSSEVNKVDEVNVVSERNEAVNVGEASEKSDIKKVNKKFETLDD